MINSPIFSIVILTYNRKDCVTNQIDSLSRLAGADIEILIVDNHSDEDVAPELSTEPRARLIRNSVNLGAVGRNSGIDAASGRYIITLDDDVYGIDRLDLDAITAIFELQTRTAAINFSVREEKTNRVTDWCHPRDLDQFQNIEFETNDISEGAVVFRREALEQVGLYPDSFFISHEGPDLAFRLINNDWSVIYSPAITVTHRYEQIARVSWRRYYYDTRNQLWLSIRNLPLLDGLLQVSISWTSLFIYATRDGYLKYWFKGVFDAVKGSSKAWRDRNKLNKTALHRWRSIESHRPSLLTRAKRRLSNSGVRG